MMQAGSMYYWMHKVLGDHDDDVSHDPEDIGAWEAVWNLFLMGIMMSLFVFTKNIRCVHCCAWIPYTTRRQGVCRRCHRRSYDDSSHVESPH